MSTKIVIRQVLERFGYSHGADRQHAAHERFPDVVRRHRNRHAGLADRAAGLLLRRPDFDSYTSMNTLAYADVSPAKASAASSIASTSQQLSIKLRRGHRGPRHHVLRAPGRTVIAHRDDPRLHHAFLALGLFTLLSTAVFSRLKREDGADETRQKDIHLG